MASRVLIASSSFSSPSVTAWACSALYCLLFLFLLFLASHHMFYDTPTFPQLFCFSAAKSARVVAMLDTKIEDFGCVYVGGRA